MVSNNFHPDFPLIRNTKTPSFGQNLFMETSKFEIL